jgi:hypothetical protein
MTDTRPSRAEKVDAATPASRNRVVDFLRAAAITVVVLGHWTIIAVDADGGILPHGVLDGATWTHPLTWVFQVMPIFFLVGGYSNALSWRSAPQGRRLRRMAARPPAPPRHPADPAAAVLARDRGGRRGRRGADATVQLASQMALIPTWFLAAYLMVILVAPPCLRAVGAVRLVVDRGRHRARRRSSTRSASPPTSRCSATRTTCWSGRRSTRSATPGSTAASRGRPTAAARRDRARGPAAARDRGAVPGLDDHRRGTDAISNSSPTRVTMAFLGMLQAGLVLSLEKPLAALLRRPRLWFVTVLVNQRIMTWFLWHLTVMVALAHLLLALDARALLPEPLSGLWWATRPLWALALLALTGSGGAGDGPLRDAAARRPPGPAGVEAAGRRGVRDRGARGDGHVGVAGESGVTWWWPLLPVVGMWVFGVVAMRHGRPAGGQL